LLWLLLRHRELEPGRQRRDPAWADTRADVFFVPDLLASVEPVRAFDLGEGWVIMAHTRLVETNQVPVWLMRAVFQANLSLAPVFPYLLRDPEPAPRARVRGLALPD
jgi:hypothetical protein